MAAAVKVLDGLTNTHAHENAVKALKGTGLTGWHPYTFSFSVIGLTGPCGYVTPERIEKLRKRWIRLGGFAVGAYLPGSQHICLEYKQVDAFFSPAAVKCRERVEAVLDREDIANNPLVNCCYSYATNEHCVYHFWGAVAVDRIGYIYEAWRKEGGEELRITPGADKDFYIAFSIY
jgi:hypothetical protein